MIKLNACCETLFKNVVLYITDCLIKKSFYQESRMFQLSGQKVETYLIIISLSLNCQLRATLVLNSSPFDELKSTGTSALVLSLF